MTLQETVDFFKDRLEPHCPTVCVMGENFNNVAVILAIFALRIEDINKAQVILGLTGIQFMERVKDEQGEFLTYFIPNKTK